MQRRPYFFAIGINIQHPMQRPTQLTDWVLLSRANDIPNSTAISCQKMGCTLSLKRGLGLANDQGLIALMTMTYTYAVKKRHVVARTSVQLTVLRYTLQFFGVWSATSPTIWALNFCENLPAVHWGLCLEQDQVIPPYEPQLDGHLLQARLFS